MKNFVSVSLGILFFAVTAGAQLPAPSVILGRKEVPVLCYHQIRDWKPTDSKGSKDYIMPPADLKAELKMLADSGYHTILPDQLYAYLTKGEALPSKPIMLTFDDTDEDQYVVAWPEMKKYGFKGVFFVMTVSLNKATSLYDQGTSKGVVRCRQRDRQSYLGSP